MPGYDPTHEDINLSALLRLLPEPIREPRAAAGRWRRIPLILQLRAVKP